MNKAIKNYIGLAVLVAAAVCLYIGAAGANVGLSIAGLGLAATVALASLVRERPHGKKGETTTKI